jgi:hypothetical protein
LCFGRASWQQAAASRTTTGVALEATVTSHRVV